MALFNNKGGDAVRNNPLVYLFSKVWEHSVGNRKNIVLFWSMFAVAETLELFVGPLIWAKIMNVIQEQGITQASIRVLLLLLGLTLLKELTFWAFHGPARVLECANAFKARINYRRFLLGGVMMLPMEWHAEHHSGDTIDRVEKGTNALFRFSEDSFLVIYGIVSFLGSYAVLVYFSRPAAYIVFGMVLLSALITVQFDRVLVQQYRELNRAENKVSESVFDAISNITTVIILRVEKLVFSAIMRKVEEPYALKNLNNKINECKWFLTNVCCSLMTIAVLSVYFLQNVGTTRGVLVGSVYLLIRYLDKISDLFFRFTSMYGDVIQYRAKVANAEELSDDFVAESFANHVLPKSWKHLDIKELNFAYANGGEELNLQGVNLSIARGERIAFVGESGSGKTTLLKVMRDLYHPNSLELVVDGAPIPAGFEGISRAIALVPQNPEIFATTIRENITLGADHELEFVRCFTDMACFTEVADGLPHGFDSSIKEKGVNLSGGQQQRLALARGLLACHDKDIVLLDEPTSSLDTTNEMRVYQNIFEAFRDKTIISSVHRLHLLPMFDRIYFFDGGRITASGCLRDMLSSCQEFQRLWQQYHDHQGRAES